MATAHRALAAIALVAAAAAAASAQSLKPQWSRPVGGKTRFVGVEEYGRCSVFVDNGAIQVVAPSGEVSWTWPFAKVSKYIHPEKVAVSHDCDAIALVGDATNKKAWIAGRDGGAATLLLSATPADISFDRRGALVAVGTFSGSLALYSRGGELQWQRDTKAGIVQGLEFSDDNQRIAFGSFAGAGVVSVAGDVESSTPAPAESTNAEERRRIALECVDASGETLATIQPGSGGVWVSKDLAQVLIVREQDLRPIAVERYVISAPCKP